MRASRSASAPSDSPLVQGSGPCSALPSQWVSVVFATGRGQAAGGLGAAVSSL